MRLRLFTDKLGSFVTWTVAAGILLLTFLVVLALGLRSSGVLEEQGFFKLLLNDTWRPLAGEFGYRPFILGTVWVTVTGMALAIPVCFLTAIFLAEYATPRIRMVLRPLIDVLAGIPSVVYGLFGVIVIVPLVGDTLAPWAGKNLSKIPWLTSDGSCTGYTVLAGGIVLAFMVMPFIISIAEEVLRGVPVSVREAALSLGATRWETTRHIVLRRAGPGLVAAVVLGFSRAFGETMAVLMVVGNVPVSPKSIFDPAYPLPALIANNYGEMMSIPRYDSALLFAALLLLLIVFGFNLAAELVLILARKRTQS